MRVHKIFSKQHSSTVPHGTLIFVRGWDLHSILNPGRVGWRKYPVSKNLTEMYKSNSMFTLSLHHALVLPCFSRISWLILWPSQAAPMCGPRSVIGVSFWKFGTSSEAPWCTNVDIAVLFFAIIAQCRAVFPWRLSVRECDAPKMSNRRVGSKLKR